MEIKSLKLLNYRNYDTLELEFNSAIELFLGENAQGKTNILEAIYYAAFARSHRTRVDSEIVKFNKELGKSELIFQRKAVKMKLEFSYPKIGKRKILLNSAPISQKELIGTINAVLFSPEDLYLIKGAPENRRHFLDAELSQSSPKYYQELLKFTHILKQRNNLLKKIKIGEANKDMLEIWNSQLVPPAANIIKARLEATTKLASHAQKIAYIISGEDLSIKYELNAPLIPIIDIQKGKENLTTTLFLWYNEMLSKAEEKDIYRGSTTIGPHHDDLCIAIKEKDLRKYGSQGQQRTGALALKLAELSYLIDETGDSPILLLDDVMSELDVKRRSSLIEFIRAKKIQTFITATDKAYFPEGLITKYHAVKEGKVELINN